MKHFPRKRRHLTWPVVILLLLALSSLALAQVGTPQNTWWTVDGGGGTASGDVYVVSGSIGQPEASGLSGDGTYKVSGGFWGAPAPPSGDSDILFLPILHRQ